MKLKHIKHGSSMIDKIVDIADELYFQATTSNYRSGNPYKEIVFGFSDIDNVVAELTNKFGKPHTSPQTVSVVTSLWHWEWTFKFHNRRFHVTVIKDTGTSKRGTSASARMEIMVLPSK